MASIDSEVWGGDPYPISQPFGVYNPELASWYKYAEDYGYPAGTHIGLDVAIPKGTKVYAAESGKVIESGFSSSFRPYPVVIEEADGDIAIYGHLWSNVVSPGQKIKEGQFIGRSGEQTIQGTMTPDGSGPHIHFELRRKDPTTGTYKAVDPVPELTGAAESFDPGLGKTLGLTSLGVTSESVGNAVTRGAAFLTGSIILAIGAWAFMGAPLPPQMALARKFAKMKGSK